MGSHSHLMGGHSHGAGGDTAGGGSTGSSGGTTSGDGNGHTGKSGRTITLASVEPILIQHDDFTIASNTNQGEQEDTDSTQQGGECPSPTKQEAIAEAATEGYTLDCDQLKRDLFVTITKQRGSYTCKLKRPKDSIVKTYLYKNGLACLQTSTRRYKPDQYRYCIYNCTNHDTDETSTYFRR